MFDYKNTNTDLAKQYTDAELLKCIENGDLPVPGWGLIAEVCNRFEILSKENEQLKNKNNWRDYYIFYFSLGSFLLIMGLTIRLMLAGVI